MTRADEVVLITGGARGIGAEAGNARAVRGRRRRDLGVAADVTSSTTTPTDPSPLR